MEEIAGALARFGSLFVIASGATLSFKGQTVSPQAAARQLWRALYAGRQRAQSGRAGADRGQAAGWRRRRPGSGPSASRTPSRTCSPCRTGWPWPSRASSSRPCAKPTPEGSRAGPPPIWAATISICAPSPSNQTVAKEPVLQALAYVAQAVELDPDFAAALALGALLHGHIVVNQWAEDPPAHRQAGLAYAERALRLAKGGDANVLAQVAVAFGRLDDDPLRGVALIDRAVELNPGSAYVWFRRLRRGAPSGRRSGADDRIRRRGPYAWTRSPPPPRCAQFHGHLARFQQGRFAESPGAVPGSPPCARHRYSPSRRPCTRTWGRWTRPGRRWRNTARSPRSRSSSWRRPSTGSPSTCSACWSGLALIEG